MTRAPAAQVAVFPGSFDPVTLGHLDLIRRAAARFSKLIVAVAHNRSKQALFPVELRVAMLRRACRGVPRVEVSAFEGLLVSYCRLAGATTVLRGLRAVSDFEYEFGMAMNNRMLDPRLETLFLLPGEPYTYLSSAIVREVAAYGGDLSRMVPPFVAAALARRFRTQPGGVDIGATGG